MKDKVYIAAALFTPQQLRVVSSIKAIVQSVGMDYFSPAEMSMPIWNGRKPADCTKAERRQVLDGNIAGLCESRILIARVSGETKEVDTGVSWEMGYFDALCRDVDGEYVEIQGDLRISIAYVEPQDRHQSLNLMLAETVHAAVYGPAQLHACLFAIRATDDDGFGPMAPNGLYDRLAEWAPDKIIKHEREPIGLDEPTIVKPRRTALPDPDPAGVEAADPEVREWEMGRGK